MQPSQRAPGLVIGVDGGKTKTLTALATTDGDILATATTGPCNHIHEPGGLERQFNALRSGSEAAFANAGLPLRRLDSVHVGVSGSGHLPTVQSVYDAETLTLTHDLPTALAGAIPSREGVIVIAGTGSAQYGRNKRDQTVMVGGQGYYAGDEGSGYDIAQRAFRAAYQAADGRAPETALTGLILDHYGSPTLRSLRDRIYGQLTRDQLAQAAALVTQAADAGDAVAITILAQAGAELGHGAAAALRRLDWTTGPAPIAPVGSVFKAGALIADPMMAAVRETNPDAYLQSPRFPPVIGALLLALAAIGVETSEPLLARVEDSRAKVGL